jgi:hypothetical protein
MREARNVSTLLVGKSEGKFRVAENTVLKWI